MPRLDPFIALLFATVAFASLLPATGVAAEVVNGVTTAAIVLLFFLHGVRLQRAALVAALADWRIHALILAATFGLFPLLGLIARAVFPGWLPAPLWLGMLYLCALPSTVQSAIAFTSIARGNVAVAVCAAAFSNLAGVFVTPLLTSALLGAAGGISLGQLGRIAGELFVPFVLGHLLRPWLGGWAEAHRRLLTFTDRGTVVLAVYASFSAAVAQGLWRSVGAGQLAALALACAALLALVLGLTLGAARLLGYAVPEQVAVMFVGSKKSLASGAPMARVLFPPAQAGAILLPVMLFHQLQLIACAEIARRYGARAGE